MSRSAAAGIVALAAANLVAVALRGGYDARFGPLHLVAHDPFKPAQILAAALLLAAFLRPREARLETKRESGFRAWTPVFGAAALMYVPSIFINFEHQDWTHMHIGAGLTADPAAAVHLFTRGQPDGFYRPLGFLSLWLDYLVFRSSAWGYHLQSIGLHFAVVFLAFFLYRNLGFERQTSLRASALFALAGVTVEPVVWPAARFDLLATAFSLAALVTALGVLRAPAIRAGRVALASALMGLAILSKETAYATPLLLVAMVATGGVWGLPRVNRRRVAIVLLSLWIPVLFGLAVRFAVYGGLGGYRPAAGGHAPQFLLTGKTVSTLVTRVFLIPPLAVNSSIPLDVVGKIALVLFAAAALSLAFAAPNPDRRKLAFIAGLAAISALPALNLVGWIGPSMLHSRYLYFPSVWILLLLAAMLARARWSAAIFAALLAANTAAAAHNMLVYRDAMQTADRIAATIASGVRAGDDDRTVCIVGLPESEEGVLVFGTHVVRRVEAALESRSVAVVRADEPCAPPVLVYKWNPASRTVEPLPTAP